MSGAGLPPRVGVIGGGILGLSLAYELTRRGARVSVFEAEAGLGGLASPFPLEDGVSVDRFYHTILSSDSNLLGLCSELGLSDRLHFASTRMGFYHAGRVYPMNGLLDFLRFPPLGWLDRLRLGLNLVAAQRIRDWRSLEHVRMTDWLTRWSGRRVMQNLWSPLLRSKFDGAYQDVPATWMWSRLTRQRTARQAGYLQGGYQALLQALASRIQASGAQVHLHHPVQQILPQNTLIPLPPSPEIGGRGGNRSSSRSSLPSPEIGRGGGGEGVRSAGSEGSIRLRLPDREEAFEAVVATQPTPVVARLLPESAPAAYRQRLLDQQYLGVLCPLLVLDRPLTGYWILNITDASVPFTGVIETTSYIPPERVGGRHLVYLPKYLVPGSPYAGMPDEAVREEWLSHALRMFPSLRPEHIQRFVVHRARYVEPLHPLRPPGAAAPEPLEIQTPVPGLFLATTAQIYPELTNGESVSRHAARVAERIAATLAAGAGA